MEKIVDEYWSLGETWAMRTSGGSLLNEESVAMILIAKKIEEQTAVMKELIQELIKLSNQR